MAGAFVAFLRFEERDGLIEVGVVKPQDASRVIRGVFESVGEFLEVEFAVAILIPAVEFLEESDHLSLDLRLRDDGADACLLLAGDRDDGREQDGESQGVIEGKWMNFHHIRENGLILLTRQARLWGMQIRLIVAGKPALAYAKLGVQEYMKRLSRFGAYEILVVRAGSREEVSARLLEKSQGSFRICMDERGQSLTTRAFAEKLETLEMRGEIKSVSFLIGAADGHTEELRRACDLVLNLSTLTMQHELALLVLLEQLYRVASLKTGAPYHRD